MHDANQAKIFSIYFQFLTWSKSVSYILRFIFDVWEARPSLIPAKQVSIVCFMAIHIITCNIYMQVASVSITILLKINKSVIFVVCLCVMYHRNNLFIILIPYFFFYYRTESFLVPILYQGWLSWCSVDISRTSFFFFGKYTHKVTTSWNPNYVHKSFAIPMVSFIVIISFVYFSKCQ